MHGASAAAALLASALAAASCGDAADGSGPARRAKPAIGTTVVRPRVAAVPSSPVDLAADLLAGRVRIEDCDPAAVATAMEHLFDGVGDHTDESDVLARLAFLQRIGPTGAPAVVGVVDHGGNTQATQLATIEALDAIDPERTRRLAPLASWLGRKDYLDDVYPPHRGLWEAGRVAIPVLAAILDDPDHRGGADAAEVLARFGADAEPALPSLRGATRSSYWLEAEWAAQAVFRASEGRELPLPAALNPLAQRAGFLADVAASRPGLAAEVAPFLRSDDPDRVRDTAQILVAIAPETPGLVDALAALADGSDELLARDAARGLADLGPRAAPAVPTLLRATASDDWDVRRGARAALAATGDRERAPPAFRAALADRSPWDQMQNAEWLIADGPENLDVALPALIGQLTEEWHGRRGGPRIGHGEAAKMIATLGAAAAPAVPALVRALGPAYSADRAPACGIQAEAATALAALGRVAIPCLTGALDDPDAEVRAGAADVLRRIGSDARVALPALRRAVRDPEPLVRCRAAIALLAFDAYESDAAAPDAAAALELSLPALPRNEQINALATLNSDHTAALGAVRRCEELPDTGVRLAAAVAEWHVTSDASRAVAEARRAFETGDEDAVRAAGTVLRELGTNARAALPAVVERLGRDPSVAWAAAAFLGSLGPDSEPAVPALVRAAESDAGRGAPVVGTLTAIGPGAPAAVPYLTAQLAGTREDREEIPLLRALAAIGPAAAPALPQVRLRLRDWHADVAAAAEEARARIELR